MEGGLTYALTFSVYIVRPIIMNLPEAPSLRMFHFQYRHVTCPSNIRADMLVE
jgi:hypothetical protein